MNITPATSNSPVSPRDLQKIVHAAQEFEAILLETFLRPLTESLSSLPGAEPEMGMSGYRDFGLQALATGMAKGGGIGLANMIVRNLVHGQGSSTASTSLGTGGTYGTKAFL